MSQSNSYKKNINKFTTNIFGDTYLPSVNGKKFEEIAYSTYFDIDILDKLSKEFTFYIFIGTDSGMMLNHLKQLNIDPSSIYLFIETLEIKAHFAKTLLETKQTNIFISTIEEWQESVKKENIIKYIEVDRIQVIKSFSAQEQIYSPYIFTTQKLHDEINQLKWIHPDKFQKNIYIQRQLENSVHNYNPALELKDLLKGKQALILAGGPSLDNYIKWIEEHQKDYVVIAVSRIARRLLSTKIVPDIFVTADPYESAFITSKEVLAYSEQSILVSQSYAHPKLISQWQGQHFYLGKLLPWNSNYKPDNINGIGPTVTNGAIHLAINMGIVDQILFGVDLCYSSEGYSHVSETVERDKGEDLGFSGSSVLTNSGQQASTTYEMLEARNSISLLADLAQKQGGIIINPSPSSASIENIMYRPIKSINTPKKTNNEHSLILTKMEKSKHEKKSLHFSKLLEEYKKIKEETNKIQNYSKKIINICSESDKIKNNESNTVYTNIIYELEKKINTQNNITDTIESFGINEYFDFIHPSILKGSETRLIIFNRYYSSLYIACDFFIKTIDNSIQQILHTSKEPLVQKDLKKQKYNFKITKNNSKPKKFQLSGLEKRLYLFFKNKNKENLRKIIHQLNLYNTDNSISMSHLAQGYLYELENNIEPSINEYLNATSEQTLESSLKRILDITLKKGDIENTVAVLYALSDISSEYLIQLANLYQTSKQYKDALDIYSKYIDKNPKDTLILIKMGILYLSLDVLDGAEFIFKHILDIDAYNQTAEGYLKKIRPEAYKSNLFTYNDITYNPVEIKRIVEYNFYQSLNELELDIPRLQTDCQKKNIGFIANTENLINKEFIDYLFELYDQINDISFTVIIFNDNTKKEVLNLFENRKDRLFFLYPNDIYELTENIEVFISTTSKNNIKLNTVNSIIVNQCKNIFVLPFTKVLKNETIEEAAERMEDSKIMRNYNQVGFSDADVKKGKQHYHRILYTKALNYKSKTTKEFTLTSNLRYDLTHIQAIKWALMSKDFIHYFFNFNHLVQNIHE